MQFAVEVAQFQQLEIQWKMTSSFEIAQSLQLLLFFSLLVTVRLMGARAVDLRQPVLPSRDTVEQTLFTCYTISRQTFNTFLGSFLRNRPLFWNGNVSAESRKTAEKYGLSEFRFSRPIFL